MTKEEAALFVSFIAMTLVIVSYFLKKKSLFLMLQTGAVVFLLLSYLFTGEYFAMIGMGLGLVRSIVYFYYERKERIVPFLWMIGICVATVAAYFIVNLGILGKAKPLDILYVVALVLFAVAFRIRDLTVMRRVTLIPIACAVIFNIFANSTPFVIASYAVEFVSNLAAIVKFELYDVWKLRKSLKENDHETN